MCEPCYRHIVHATSGTKPSRTRALLASTVAFLATGGAALALSLPAVLLERWAGFLVIGLLSAIFGAFYISDRLPFGHPSAYALGLIVAALLSIPAAFFAQFFEAGLDDGPFHGRIFTAETSVLEKSHAVPYRAGELVIYNRAENETPVLAYLVDGVPDWALEMDVAANPEYGSTEFRSVSGPISVSHGIVRDRLEFIAHWSFGTERGYAYIWKFGGVQRFYLSW